MLKVWHSAWKFSNYISNSILFYNPHSYSIWTPSENASSNITNISHSSLLSLSSLHAWHYIILLKGINALWHQAITNSLLLKMSCMQQCFVPVGKWLTCVFCLLGHWGSYKTEGSFSLTALKYYKAAWKQGFNTVVHHWALTEEWNCELCKTWYLTELLRIAGSH